jgi:hypothetical protein
MRQFNSRVTAADDFELRPYRLTDNGAKGKLKSLPDYFSVYLTGSDTESAITHCVIYRIPNMKGYKILSPYIVRAYKPYFALDIQATIPKRFTWIDLFPI